MKRITALVLAAGMMLAMLSGCGSSNGSAAASSAAGSTAAATEAGSGAETTSGTDKIALVTDVGNIDDESFNQTCYEAMVAYGKEHNIETTYYKPTEDSTDARVTSITQAVNEGATVIVMPGYLFGEAIGQTQDLYPDVKFIAVDVGESDLGDTTLAKNTHTMVFHEEQAGYLAGYAAVMEGYTKLGYLGGMAVPAVQRYGYGYIQGINDAANEKGVDVEIKYTYGGQFQGSPEITAKMEGWYQNGTEIVFASGGGIYTSALEAAKKTDGAKLIGVDVDQSYIDPAYFVTSAMKQLKNVTMTVLDALNSGSWETYGGKVTNFGLQEGDYVGLPTADSSWSFKTFTKDEYNAVLEGIRSGKIVVDNNSDSTVTPTVSAHTSVDYIG